ncbi:MAG: hypothetical protein WDZ80_02795 [Candidatus Paceibacterota bacterium]
MADNLVSWDIYEISTKTTPINGVMLRGRIRKLCLENNTNVLVENTQDVDGRVRFAVINGESPTDIVNYLNKILPDVKIELVKENVVNPVLSKLKVNIKERYNL